MSSHTSSPRAGDWSDRLYPYAHKEPLYHYVKPGQMLTAAEHSLNKGALQGRWTFVDEVLPGGGETRYITHPQVAIGNWWERMVAEKPGFLNSMGRRLPDNLTKCSEYREEISEYAKYFKDYPDEEIRPPPSDATTRFVPMEVKLDYRKGESPLTYWMSVYNRDFHRPQPCIPPQQFNWADAKRKKWIEETLDNNVDFCTEYQKNYHRTIYENLAEQARRASLCPYIKVEEQQEYLKRVERANEDIPRRIERDKCLQEEMERQKSACFIRNGQCDPACLPSATVDPFEQR